MPIGNILAHIIYVKYTSCSCVSESLYCCKSKIYIHTHLSANCVNENNSSLLLVIEDGMVGNDCTCTSIDIFCLVFFRDC